MAGMQTRFLNSPGYQRMVQRMGRLGPEQKAIFDTIEADEVYANQEMRQYLQGIRLANDRTARDRDYSLRTRDADWRKDQADKAQKVGWANVGIGGLAGIGDYMNKRKETKHLKTLAGIWGKK